MGQKKIYTFRDYDLIENDSAMSVNSFENNLGTSFAPQSNELTLELFGTPQSNERNSSLELFGTPQSNELTIDLFGTPQSNERNSSLELFGTPQSNELTLDLFGTHQYEEPQNWNGYMQDTIDVVSSEDNEDWVQAIRNQI